MPNSFYWFTFLLKACDIAALKSREEYYRRRRDLHQKNDSDYDCTDLFQEEGAGYIFYGIEGLDQVIVISVSLRFFPVR